MPRSSVLVFLPHKKRKTTFREWGGQFAGHLLDDVTSYSQYLFWTYAVPGTTMKTGWTCSRPSDNELSVWKEWLNQPEDEIDNIVIADKNRAKQEALTQYDVFVKRY